MTRQKILVVIGTRPEGIKMAPVIRALQASQKLEPVVVNTGQHREMLDQVLDIFGITCDHSLRVMTANQSLAQLNARLLEQIDPLLTQVKPAFALVQGDTTTVLATALACFYRQVGVGHVEAGLRSGDMMAPFPEEANRVIASRLSTLHFAPTSTARDNLLAEHIPESQVFVTGNTVIDALHLEIQRQEKPEVREPLRRTLGSLLGEGWENRDYVLVTGHRRENFGSGFENICRALAALAERFPGVRFVYPVHLNPNVRGPVYESLGSHGNITLIPPQPYAEFVALLRHCKLVLTDSGGVQEEAPGFGKPVLVMREVTERPEGVAAGTVRLVGANEERIVQGVSELLSDAQAYAAMAQAVNPYGDGKAAPRILSAIERHLGIA